MTLEEESGSMPPDCLRLMLKPFWGKFKVQESNKYHLVYTLTCNTCSKTVMIFSSILGGRGDW